MRIPHRLLCMLLFFLFTGVSVVAQTTADTLYIESLLQKHPAKFKKVLDHPGKYKIQIIYTRIDRDKNNIPSFKEFRYRLNRQSYFYCASLVKLPCCALALQKLEELAIPGLSSESRMITDSIANCQKKTERDSTSETGYPSLAQYIRRMLLISDNDAYSRCYEFLGQEYIHQQLETKGYPDAFILQRFDGGCNTADNACTNPVTFYDSTGTLLYHQKEANCTRLMVHPLGKPTAGLAFIDINGDKVDQPKDFSHSNFLSLEEVTTMLRSIIFPESVVPSQRFNISAPARLFMLNYMSMLPGESRYPRYKTSSFYDSYKKYLIYGDNRSPLKQDSLRIFNVVGQSYGFVSDVAYVCDFKNNVEFMLSAVIYTNEDEVINDNKYEYRSVALPFMAELGKAVYNEERKRKRINPPNLTAFRFNYK
jgi:hypothetical protein